jgi:DNA-binding SARP family transcriptional activator
MLGPLQVVLDGRTVDVPAGRLRVLLAVLALAAGRPVPAERLATAVWGEDSDVDARANLHSNVRRLRRLLGDDLVSTRDAGYALRIEPDRVDALRMTRLLGENRITDALALWRGEPFDGIRSDWLDRTEAPRLREIHLTAVERRIDNDLASGSSAEVVAEVVAELTS